MSSDRNIFTGEIEKLKNMHFINSLLPAGLMWWMLAREVLRLRGSIGRGSPVSSIPSPLQ